MEEIKTEEHENQETLIEDKTGAIQESNEDIIKERKDKIMKFLKNNYNLIAYIVLAIIVWLSVKIRTRNLPLLRDITTETWTLGPDLDPFLFLRWAKYIVENGTLFAMDTMRYVPLGYDVRGELLFHPYLMAWFHKIAVLFGSESVTHSAVLYPVFMFALTVIALFLFTRKIFVSSLGERQANIIALISSFFLTIIPVLLPRTIAGIPEKESAAFLFMFLAFYFFLCSWESKKFVRGATFAILAGASTAGIALIWGGALFVFLTIGPAAFIAFLLGKMDKQKFYLYSLWVVSALALVYPFSTRFSIIGFFTTYITGSLIFVFFVAAFHMFVFTPYLAKYFTSEKLSKIPPKIISTILLLIFIFFAISIFFGPSFIFSQIKSIWDTLIAPSSTRLLLTVAENRQPYFTEWSGSFGPIFKGQPIFFWLIFFGSIYLFYKMISRMLMKKERIMLVLSYVAFLFFLIFSRYSPNSTFNGTNMLSIFVYILGFVALVGCFGYYYYIYHKRNEEHKLKNIEMGFIMLFIFFFFSILAARSAVRTIMVLVPSASIIVSYFSVAIFNDAKKIKDNTLKTTAWVIVGIIIIAMVFAGYRFYGQINAEAANYAPSIYTQQWQKAMEWVRDNTPKDAVFGHWWDYGYWLQSIGERATVLDGGNAIGHWNHLMGRYALTGTNNTEAIEFLHAHDTTHFLIDSTDIGKYGAFSSIGSDLGYDRRSWISTFLRDNNQVQETKNSTIFVYAGGTVLDGDIIYDNNGTRIFLPGGSAGIGAVLIEMDSSRNLSSQPQGIFVYQNKQYKLPLRYAYVKGKFIDFGSGVESGVFLYTKLTQTSLELDGALLYLSERTVKSQLARLYLYKEDNPYFKLVHSEDDFLVAQVKAQNPEIGDFVEYGGLRGPIRIWEIDYPSEVGFREEYMLTYYPEEKLI